MLAIRINTLMRGHSGVRPSTLQALADLLNAGVVPVVPKLGSVGASGDLAPLSHLAIVLLGEGEAFYQRERHPGAQPVQRAGRAPSSLSPTGPDVRPVGKECDSTCCSRRATDH